MENWVRAFVRRFFRGTSGSAPNGPSILTCTNLWPVRRHSGSATALSKAGRLVMRGELAGAPVKLFEAASADHARFIEAIWRHERLGDHLPRICLVEGPFVVAEWVTRAARGEPSAEDLVALQLRLHRAPVAGLPQPGFDYWSDIVMPRFRRAAVLLREQELVESIETRVSAAWYGSPQRLMHPDLTPANLVLGGDRRWRIVDNELLAPGGLPLLDVCNTARALFPPEAQKYADLYFHEARVMPSREDIKILQDAWLARRVGGAFVAGDLLRAASMVRAFKSGLNILPFSPMGALADGHGRS